MPLKNCVVCGNEFKARLSAYKTCGTVCRNRLIAAEKEQRHTAVQPCSVCGKEFANTGKQKHRKTCSVKCGHVVAGQARRNREARSCATCSKEFETTVGSHEKYCSPACGFGRNKTERPCEICGTVFRSPPSQMHVRTCSVECGHKNHENSRVMLDCKTCGKQFEEDECHADRRTFCSHKCKHDHPETKARQSAAFAKEKNPAWMGGIGIKAVSAAGREYFRMSPAKENARSARRKSQKMQATPSWADPVLIMAFYEEAQRLSAVTGIVHHVDHMVPLQSKHVCGLHSHDNLCVMVGAENISKSNRKWPDMP